MRYIIYLKAQLKAYISNNGSQFQPISAGPEWDEFNKINITELISTTHNSFFIKQCQLNHLNCWKNWKFVLTYFDAVLAEHRAILHGLPVEN